MQRLVSPLLRVWHARRGNVAVLSSLLMPMFMGAAGLGVEASNWSVLQVELQRKADVAAIGAGLGYAASSNAHTAAGIGADVAEMNGMTAGTRTWSATTKTLTDGVVTIQQVSGVRNSSDIAFQVTLGQSVSPVIAKLFLASSSYTLPATATVELVPTTSTQPCLVALGTASTAISISGATTITAAGCSARSNGGVGLSGSSSITAAAVYAGGTITTSGTAAVHATKYTNDGTIPDPYASSTVVQSAIAQLKAGSGTAYSSPTYGTAAVSPGTYSSITTQGSASVTLSPGLYIVNGNVNFGAGSTVAASGVTIVSSGTLSISGSVPVTWTAPTTTSTSGIPGIAYVTTSTGSVSLGGSGSLSITGVVYAPNAPMTISGAASYGTTSCLEVVVNTLTLTGSGAFSSSGCSSLGALSFGSINSSTASLVQ